MKIFDTQIYHCNGVTKKKKTENPGKKVCIFLRVCFCSLNFTLIKAFLREKRTFLKIFLYKVVYFIQSFLLVLTT